jgi:uncharacterized protein (DUF697 family)
MNKQDWTEYQKVAPDPASLIEPFPRRRNYQSADFEEASRYSDGMLQSLMGRNPDLLDAADEVAADQAVRIFLVSPQRELPRRLLAHLRREQVPAFGGLYAHHGVWLLVALPEAGNHAKDGDEEESADDRVEEDSVGTVEKLLGRLEALTPDIVLYLVDLERGWAAEDTAWIGQLRTLGTPMLPVILDGAGIAHALQPPAESANGASAPLAESVTETVRRLVGLKAVMVVVKTSWTGSASDDTPPADVIALTQRIVALRPRVAVALAQDISWCRPFLARRIIRTGALLTALVSAQPVPLLDLPFQVALQWKVALQLAAIYGRPGLDYRSREMMGTIAWNLLIRFLIQQTVKFVPVMGWLLSAGIGWVSTVLLGHGLVTIYENEDRWDLERQGKRVLERAGMAVAPVCSASVRAVDSVRTQAETLAQRMRRVSQALQVAWRDDPADSAADAPAEQEADMGTTMADGSPATDGSQSNARPVDGTEVTMFMVLHAGKGSSAGNGAELHL